MGRGLDATVSIKTSPSLCACTFAKARLKLSATMPTSRVAKANLGIRMVSQPVLPNCSHRAALSFKLSGLTASGAATLATRRNSVPISRYSVKTAWHALQVADVLGSFPRNGFTIAKRGDKLHCIVACHTNLLSLCHIFRNASRAVNNRDLTVPAGTFRISASSS